MDLIRKSDGAKVEGFSLGGDEHAKAVPRWFHEACSADRVTLTRHDANTISATLENGDKANQGDWIVRDDAGAITIVAADMFGEELADLPKPTL